MVDFERQEIAGFPIPDANDDALMPVLMTVSATETISFLQDFDADSQTAGGQNLAPGAFPLWHAEPQALTVSKCETLFSQICDALPAPTDCATLHPWLSPSGDDALITEGTPT
ncbi:hypothetical protein KUV65_09840 [Maritalea mobilis]|uniref:hypothetical protein n=1 Tax=Maritalea mobilis TaxID=483324 RepID=UPI001C95A2B4|nr:hypothetical protein [Maritalea mobilis]MBY6201663.1 hypothetical protein [Maritalea mobilis]